MTLENAGRLQITRKHPLTVEGEEIGSFDLTFACGEPGKDLAVTYFEQRRGGRKADVLTEVEMSIAGKSVPLKVVSSQPGGADAGVRFGRARAACRSSCSRASPIRAAARC